MASGQTASLDRNPSWLGLGLGGGGGSVSGGVPVTEEGTVWGACPQK